MRLALFISLKSLFMDNEQCQTCVQEKKKHRKRNARNAIPKRHVSVLIASTNLCRIQSFFLYLFFNYSNLVHSKNLQFEMIMESRN